VDSLDALAIMQDFASIPGDELTRSLSESSNLHANAQQTEL
jgi:hypothetical protein